MNYGLAKVTVLDNGVRAITRRVPPLKNYRGCVNIAVRIEAGARDEITGRKYPAGSMHFLEHLLSYGSKKYPTPTRDLIKSVGGTFNIAALLSSTVCTVTVPSEHAVYALEVLGAMFSNPILDKSHVEAERSVIQIERAGGELDPKRIEELWPLYVGHGKNPRLYPVIGHERGIDEVSSETMENIYAEHFRGGRIIVAVERDIDHQEIVDAIDKSFRLAPGVREPTEVPVYTGGDDRHPLAVGATYLVAGFKAPRPGELDQQAAFRVTQSLLTARDGEGGPHSFFNALRNNGLAYQVEVVNRITTDASMLTISSATLPRRGYSEKVLQTINAVLARLAECVDPVSFERVMSNAREENKRAQKYDLYGPENMASDYYYNGCVLAPHHCSEQELKVTQADIRKVARDLLVNRSTLLATGDLSNVPAPDEVDNILCGSLSSAIPDEPIFTPIVLQGGILKAA